MDEVMKPLEKPVINYGVDLVKNKNDFYSILHRNVIFKKV